MLPGDVPTRACALRYLEAIENSNVDFHQRLVLPQGGCLPHVQVHLLGHFLKQERNTDSQAGPPQDRQGYQ